MGRVTGLKSRLVGEAAVHTAVRVVSGLLSLYLFALIARLYPADEVKDLYFFLLIFGFAASALRTLANVSAGLDAARSKTWKLRRIQSATGEVLLASLVFVPVAVWLLGQHVRHPALLACAVLVLAGAAVDSDPLRALVDRPARFATSFALGSALAVAWLLLMAPGRADQAVIAMLLQWLPVATINLACLRRIGVDSVAAGLRRLRSEAASVGTLFVVAIFDGFVLNLPFLLGGHVSAAVGIDAAVVIRIFSASLIMFPLVLHWSNSSTLAQVSRRLGVAPGATYFSIQACSAVVCGLVFGWTYAWLSQQRLGLPQLAMFTALVLSFCAYTTAARFDGRMASGRVLAPVLGIVGAFALAGGLYLLSLPDVHAFAVAALQCAALLLGGLAIQAIARANGGDAPPSSHRSA
jgi:hypothetical protein